MISTLGSLLIIKPSFSNILLIPSLFCLSDAVLSGVAYTYVRRLGLKGMPSCLIVFYFSLSSTIATAPFFIFDFHVMSVLQVLLLFLAGLSGIATQLCLTSAYKAAPAKDISVYEYSQVIFAAIFGLAFLNQIPDILSVVGYIVIFSSALLMYLYQQRNVSC